MLELKRRDLLLAGVSWLALSGPTRAGFFGGFVGGGGGGGSSVQLATLTLVNTSASAVSDGAISPMFGWCFKKADIPTGAAPIFKVGGVAQPYSWGLQTYWTDGSLKFASFFLRMTSTGGITGGIGNTLDIQVWSGGTAPSASSRTLAEVYNQTIVLTAVGAGANFNLANTWKAWLNTSSTTDTNLNSRAYVTHDGDAGKAWYFDIDMAQTQSGTPHGQLVSTLYVASLTAANGTHLGCRFLPDINQPWYDRDVGTGYPQKNVRLFTSVSWTVNGGSAQNFPFPYAAKNFTGSSGAGAQFTTTTTHNYDEGARVGIPCIITGSPPPPLTTTQPYFVGNYVSNTTVGFGLQSSDLSGGNFIIATGSGGTATVTPVLGVGSFDHLFGAVSSSTSDPLNGRWNYFAAGATSPSADSTIRTKYDATYWHSTGLIPPLDLSKRAGQASPFSDNQSYGTTAWDPFNVLTQATNQEATGERFDIGPITAWHAYHFFNQSALDEAIIRILALSDAHQGACFKESTTRNLVNLSNSTYTGMPSATPTVRYLPPNYGANVGFTSPQDYPMIFSLVDCSHMPQRSYYTYLVTGETQYLHLLCEKANFANLQAAPSQRNPSELSQRYGVAAFPDGGAVRDVAWAARDISLAAGVVPQTMPDGSAFNTYIKDRNSATWDYNLEIITGNRNGSFLSNNGWHVVTEGNADGSGDAVQIPGQWLWNYFVEATCYAAAVTENASAVSLVSKHAQAFAYLFSQLGGWYFTNYYSKMGNAVGLDSNSMRTPITSISDFGVGGTEIFGLAWTSSNPAFTTDDMANHVFNWPVTRSFSNGDLLWFRGTQGSRAVPSGFTQLTKYVIRDIANSGTHNQTFNLYMAPSGGSPIIPSNSTGSPIDQFSTWTQRQNTGLSTGPGSWNRALGIQTVLGAMECINWMKAITGTSSVDTLKIDIQDRIDVYFSEGGTVDNTDGDVKSIMQPTF